MARNNQRGGTTTRRAPKDLGRRVKKKPCALCKDRSPWVDYKDVPMLRKYMSDRGKIRSRRVTGNCAQHQRALAMAIKTARELVLLPYTQRTVTERPGGRGGGRDRGERAERTLSDTLGSEARRESEREALTPASTDEVAATVADDTAASDTAASDTAASDTAASDTAVDDTVVADAPEAEAEVEAVATDDAADAPAGDDEAQDGAE
jgi:small subunit ribosomal protein S18